MICFCFLFSFGFCFPSVLKPEEELELLNTRGEVRGIERPSCHSKHTNSREIKL